MLVINYFNSLKIKFSNLLASLAFLIPLILIDFGVTLASQKAEENDQSELTIDYLKNLPVSDYILGPGDTIKINVSRDYPELESIVKIGREGTIYLPKIKRIYIEGLTINELNDLLSEAFLEFVKFPSIEVEVISYRPIRVYIDGEVENPGLQTLGGAFSLNKLIDQSDDENLENVKVDLPANSVTNYFPTVFDAIREAGGITRFSNLKEVELVRINNLSDGGGRKRTILDFERVIYNGDISQNIRIYDGDLINIKKLAETNLKQLAKATKSNLNSKFINVVVSGRVNNPGRVKLSKTSTLNDAIDLAGGAKILKGKTRFLRFEDDGTIDSRKINYSRGNRRGTFKNPYLKNGDLILVGNSLLSSTNEVLTEVTRPITGIFSTYGLIKAISD